MIARKTPSITVGGVNVCPGTGTGVQTRSVSYGRKAGGIGEARIVVTDPSGAFAPNEHDPVVIAMDGATEWTGEVSDLSGGWMMLSTGLALTLSCQDHYQIPSRVVARAALPTQNLKSHLTSVVAWLSAHGVTLDPTQANGPTVDAFDPTGGFASDVIAALAKASGWVATMSAGKVLKMIAPGTVSSGVTISKANGNLVGVTWSKRRFSYRNTQIVVYGPTEVRAVRDAWTGDGVSRTFALHYSPSAAPGAITYGGVTYPVGIFGSGGQWTYRDADRTLVEDGAFAPVGVGVAITADYYSQYPNTVTVTDAAEVLARGPWEARDVRPEITDYLSAVAWGQALIAQNLVTLKVPNVTTLETGINAGETVVVDVPEQGLSALTCFVDGWTKSGTLSDDKVALVTDLSLLGTGTLRQDSIVDLWRQILGGASGGASVGVSASLASGLTSPAFLGGSRNTSVALAIAAYAPVPNHVTFVAASTVTVRVRAEIWARNGGVGVTARLYCVTDAASVGASSTVTATVATEVTFAADVTAGKSYRLEIMASTNNQGVFGIGQLESV